jgi:hypothetical protein
MMSIQSCAVFVSGPQYDRDGIIIAQHHNGFNHDRSERHNQRHHNERHERID